MRGLFVAVLAGLLSACSPWLPRYAPALSSAETGFYDSAQTPQLALLEYRLGKYFARTKRPYAVVCAAAQNIVPHERSSRPSQLDANIELALLTRFPQLSPLSRCERRGLDIVASDTGEAAAIFDVHDFQCDRPNECLGYAGSYANGEHGWSYYRMRFDRGEWRIKPEELDIIPTGAER